LLFGFLNDTIINEKYAEKHGIKLYGIWLIRLEKIPAVECIVKLSLK